MPAAEISLSEQLITAVDSKQSCLFAGAGFSRPFQNTRGDSLPTFGELVELIVEINGELFTGEFNMNGMREFARSDPILAVDRLCKEVGENTIKREACSFLKVDNTSLNELYKDAYTDLFSKFNLVVTTNYDSAIEYILKLTEGTYASDTLKEIDDKIDESEAIDSYKEFIDSKLTQEDKYLIYLHGRIDDPHEIVISSKDYNRFYGSTFQSEHAGFISNIIKEWNTMFFGVGLTDPPLLRRFWTGKERKSNSIKMHDVIAVYGTDAKARRWESLRDNFEFSLSWIHGDKQSHISEGLSQINGTLSDPGSPEDLEE